MWLLKKLNSRIDTTIRKNTNILQLILKLKIGKPT